ncbi:ComEC/Rec2 family competence protein [Microbacterium sp. STN6]|uniref:ComEC/Rec2 family competence protein n=1 Tax=Microbacterium sp. STN6 TaxID=2995588 RepID=UPI002260EC48|nr:ComEC/Rec2 family competence protein [Microbacterium sp. STN6]MCX7522292.1 ComEC/Rec2 family competence protein [Microbacterium sp. STN6]
MSLDLRLAVVATACWLACGILIALPGAAMWAAIGMWGGAVVVVAAGLALRSRRSLARSLALLCVCLAVSGVGAAAIAVVAPTRHPLALAQVARGARTVTAEIAVQSAPHASHGDSLGATQREQFTGTMRRVEYAGTLYRLSAPVLVFVPATGGAALQIGDVVEVRATVVALADEEETAFLVMAPETPTVSQAAPAWLAWANGLRERFSEATARLPGDGGDLLAGLAIGDVRQVSPVLDANMKASSLSHLTAVSGSNCAMIIGIVMLGGAALGLRRGVWVTLALVSLAGFVILVTPGPSVLRAAVMAVIVVASAAAGRPGRGVPALAAAVIALLVADPWMSRNYGFALSVLATAGLLVFARPLAGTLARLLPRTLATVIAVPLAAQLFCQPVLIMLNATIPLYGVAANMLAEPAAPLGTGFGLIACLLMPVLPGVAFAFAQVAWVPSAWIAAVARVTVSLPASNLPWLGGAAGVLVLTALTVLVLIVVFARNHPRARTLVTASTVMLLAFSGVYAGTLVGAPIGQARSIPSDWQIAACDIGQGDAVLVRSGTLHALVDVGPDPVPLAACLKTLGIARIDLLVLTHYDMDHVGGLQAVIGHVGTALVGRPETAKDERKVRALVDGGAHVVGAVRGDHGTLGALTWRVLWPRAGSRLMQTGNEGSVTVAFEGAGIRSIFLGDLDERAQEALLAAGGIGHVDVVKVAHHGSADQSERLYAALRATLGVISVGADNTYGHPTPRLLGILRTVGTRALRTDLSGMVMIAPASGGSGEALTVWTQRSASISPAPSVSPTPSASPSAVADSVTIARIGLSGDGLSRDEGGAWQHERAAGRGRPPTPRAKARSPSRSHSCHGMRCVPHRSCWSPAPSRCSPIVPFACCATA